MGGYVDHPDIGHSLQAFRDTGAIYDTADFERQLTGLVYHALCWEFLHDLVDPAVMQDIEIRVDELIRADASASKTKGLA